MPQEDYAAEEMASQSEFPLRWVVYFVMWIFGLFTIVTGMAAHEPSSNWEYLSYASFEPTSFHMRLMSARVYLVWIIATVTFVYLNMKPTKTFVM